MIEFLIYLFLSMCFLIIAIIFFHLAYLNIKSVFYQNRFSKSTKSKGG